MIDPPGYLPQSCPRHGYRTELRTSPHSRPAARPQPQPRNGQELTFRTLSAGRAGAAAWLRENPRTWLSAVSAVAVLLLATGTLCAAVRPDAPDPTPVYGLLTPVTAIVTATYTRSAHCARDGGDTAADARPQAERTATAAAQAASLFGAAFNTSCRCGADCRAGGEL